MGMFSFNCKECGHPMLSDGVTTPGINEWMSQCMKFPLGLGPGGTYDGYEGQVSPAWEAREAQRRLEERKGHWMDTRWMIDEG